MYLQKRTFRASTSRKRLYTLPFTIETVSIRQAAAWTVSNLGYATFGMKHTLTSHIQNAECPRMATRGETQMRRWVPFGIGPIHPSHDFHAVPPRIAKRDETQTRRGAHLNRSHPSLTGLSCGTHPPPPSLASTPARPRLSRGVAMEVAPPPRTSPRGSRAAVGLDLYPPPPLPPPLPPPHPKVADRATRQALTARKSNRSTDGDLP
jgi:hypothetical protein